MVRVLGSSTERVPLPDLLDVVYYKQIKEYTDQEYEQSKDLKREIARGRLTILEKNSSPRGSVEISKANGSNLAELKSAIREILPEIQGQQIDTIGVAREIAPIIAEIVRQEVSKVSVTVQSSAGIVAQTPAFVGPEYIPTVSTEGMISNVEAKTTETSSISADEALNALRQLRDQQK